MDKLSPERRSENMRRIRSTDMKPEMVVRRILHAEGFRYRLHVRDLPGRPDLVFRRLRKAIFVHGCFWHQHRDCIDGRVPRSNQGYWKPKLDRNVQRDREARDALEAEGWTVLVVWECETQDPERVRATVTRFLSGHHTTR